MQFSTISTFKAQLQRGLPDPSSKGPVLGSTLGARVASHRWCSYHGSCSGTFILHFRWWHLHEGKLLVSTRNKQLGEDSSPTCHSPGPVRPSAKGQQQMATARPSAPPMLRTAAVSGRSPPAVSSAEPQEPGASPRTATHPGRLAAGFAAADVQQLLLIVHCTLRGILLGVRHGRACCRYQLTSPSASVCVASPQPNPASQPAIQGGNSGPSEAGQKRPSKAATPYLMLRLHGKPTQCNSKDAAGQGQVEDSIAVAPQVVADSGCPAFARLETVNSDDALRQLLSEGSNPVCL